MYFISSEENDQSGSVRKGDLMMAKLIQGTHHIAIKCADDAMYEKTVEFYSKVLGLEIVRSWGSGADAGTMLDTGNSLIEVFASGRTLPQTGTVNHFALAADDVDACVQAVREAGYAITMEPEDIVIPSAVPYPARIAFCVGPAGEEIEFFHEK